jgi:hypothetical protein
MLNRPLRIPACIVASGLFAVSCAADHSGGASQASPILDRYPSIASLSDAGDFYARASIQIDAVSGGGRAVTLMLMGSNFANDPTSSAFGTGRAVMGVDFAWGMTTEEVNVFASGAVVPLHAAGLMYGPDGGQVLREVSDVQLTVDDRGSATLSATLTSAAPFEGQTTLGSATTLTVVGPVPVQCAAPHPSGGGVVDDTMFSTQFCKDALAELGLQDLRDSQL